MNEPERGGELTPEGLIESIENGSQVQILDIRAPERLENGYIDIGDSERFVNVRGSVVAASPDLEQLGLKKELPVAVVCAAGNDSRRIAALLSSKGYEAKSVAGGMARWMHVLAERPLDPPSSVDHLLQFDRPGKGSLSYLLASDGKALLVDVPRNTQPLLDAAERLGVEVIGVAETHVHADYISGGPALVKQLGVPYYLHEQDSFYPYDETPGKLDFESIEDGNVIEVGKTRAKVFHNPGHTLGSVTFLVGDDLALTGDFIFVESLGRPDLGGKTESWAKMLWSSIERAKDEWPEETTVLPAHYASNEERTADHTVRSTWGELLKQNGPLTISSQPDFLKWVNEHKSTFPMAYRKIKGINIGIIDVPETEADVLEAGKNECAVA